MGCNCGGGQRGVGRRPVVTPRGQSIRLSGPTPTQMRTIKMQALSDENSVQQREVINKRRREAVMRKLGKA